MGKARVLVTGGAGFVGSHIVDELLIAGYTPIVVDNLSSGRRTNLPPSVPLYEVDIRDNARVGRVFSEVKPTFVVHQAAQTSVGNSMRDPHFDAEANILGWLRILEQSVRLGVKRVVLASSGGALYGDVYRPVDEGFPAQPLSPYGISKWVGEQYLRFYVREHGLQGVALRYSNVYGPRQSPHGEAGVIAIFGQKLLSGEPITVFGDGSSVRDYVYVQDVARANLLAIEAHMDDGYTPLNVGTGVGTSVNALVEKLIPLTMPGLRQRDGSQLASVQYSSPRPGDLQSSILLSARARALMGWSAAVTLGEGLRSTVAWFKEAADLSDQHGAVRFGLQQTGRR